MIATATGRRRWFRDEDDGPYVSLPYGNPSEGEYFGPASIGGPPGAHARRHSKSRTADIVRRIQARMTQSLDLEDRDLYDEESRPCQHNNTAGSVNSIHLEDHSGLTATISDPQLVLSIQNHVHLPGGVSPLRYPRSSRSPTQSIVIEQHLTEIEGLSPKEHRKDIMQILQNKNSVKLRESPHSVTIAPPIDISTTGCHNQGEINTTTVSSSEKNHGSSLGRKLEGNLTTTRAIEDSNYTQKELKLEILNLEEDLPYREVAEAIIPKRWRPEMGVKPMWKTIPEKPVLDNPDAQALEPPPLKDLPQYPAYGILTQHMGAVEPPEPPIGPIGQPPEMQFDSLSEPTDNDCRQAIIALASKYCCYGNEAANEHEIKQMKTSTILQYCLESFCEFREAGYQYEPYTDQSIEGGLGKLAPPPPWSLPCEPTSNFQNHIRLLDVPHSSVIRPCHHCTGQGFNKCHRCFGLGQLRCRHCSGEGRQLYSVAHLNGPRRSKKCQPCAGSGTIGCDTCSGSGCVECVTCYGYCNLRLYIQIRVSFVNHVNESLLGGNEWPEKVLHGADTTDIFSQTLPQVWPIKDHPEEELNECSSNLIEAHRSKWPNQRMLLQRQVVRAVAVTEIDASWEEIVFKYWVYGSQQQALCTDYPQTCCGCVIL